MTIGDFIVLGVLALIVSLVIYFFIKNKKSGKSCSCGCSHCEKRDLCHPPKK